MIKAKKMKNSRKKNSHESIANVPKIEVINSITQIDCRKRENILYVYSDFICIFVFALLFLGRSFTNCFCHLAV